MTLQVSDDEGALAAPKAALVKRMVNIRQITMVEADLFQRQDFDDQVIYADYDL